MGLFETVSYVSCKGEESGMEKGESVWVVDGARDALGDAEIGFRRPLCKTEGKDGLVVRGGMERDCFGGVDS